MDTQIDPTYSFVYCQNRKFFAFAPMDPLQRESLDAFNEDFYNAWLNTGTFNPRLFVSSVAYRKTVKICRIMFEKVFKIYREIPIDLPLQIDQILDETNNQLFKIFKKKLRFNLQENFEFHYNQVNYLNQGLKGELGQAIRNIKTGPTGADYFLRFTVGTRVNQLNTQPIFIFPNVTTTIAIVLIPNSGFSLKLFEHYQSFYVFIKALYNQLKMMEVGK